MTGLLIFLLWGFAVFFKILSTNICYFVLRQKHYLNSDLFIYYAARIAPRSCKYKVDLCTLSLGAVVGTGRTML